MLVVELRSHSNTKTIQWGRQQLLILVVDSETQPYFLHLFFQAYLTILKTTLQDLLCDAGLKKQARTSTLFKRWIIKNRYSFLKWWGLGQTHSLFEYQLMLSIETKVCLLYRILFLDFVILLMMYSWSVVRRHRIYESQLFSISSIFGHGDFKEGIHLFFWMGVVF